MIHILYKITYLPHLGTKFPKYYIGSKYNYKGNYYGSLSSTQTFDYTGKLKLKDWWKNQDVSLFRFDILNTFVRITPLRLVEKERDLHIKLNVLSDKYFNQNIATKGFCSIKNTKETKLKKSVSGKAFYKTKEGKLKRQNISAKNREIKSEQMKNKWENPTEKMKNIPRDGRPKGVKDLKKRKKRTDYIKNKKLYIDGVIFNNAKEASKVLNKSISTIYSRCRKSFKRSWYYI